jgi:hypothetical protein
LESRIEIIIGIEKNIEVDFYPEIDRTNRHPVILFYKIENIEKSDDSKKILVCKLVEISIS